MSRESYWAAGRPRECMARSIEHSLVLGLYTAEDKQAGFARLVTDRATFAWLCDVFVAAEHRGGGAGSFLVQTAIGHPDVADIRQLLMAHPAGPCTGDMVSATSSARSAGWNAAR